MKRTTRHGEINNNEQIRYEFPARRSGGHRVRKLEKERKFNRQLIRNLEILHR